MFTISFCPILIKSIINPRLFMCSKFRSLHDAEVNILTGLHVEVNILCWSPHWGPKLLYSLSKKMNFWYKSAYKSAQCSEIRLEFTFLREDFIRGVYRGRNWLNLTQMTENNVLRKRYWFACDWHWDRGKIYCSVWEHIAYFFIRFSQSACLCWLCPIWVTCFLVHESVLLPKVFWCHAFRVSKKCSIAEQSDRSEEPRTRSCFSLWSKPQSLSRRVWILFASMLNLFSQSSNQPFFRSSAEAARRSYNNFQIFCSWKVLTSMTHE